VKPRQPAPGQGAKPGRMSSETKGERGKRYSFLNICVTRSLKYRVRSMEEVVPEESNSGFTAILSVILLEAGRAAPRHWTSTVYFGAGSLRISTWPGIDRTVTARPFTVTAGGSPRAGNRRRSDNNLGNRRSIVYVSLVPLRVKAMPASGWRNVAWSHAAGSPEAIRSSPARASGRRPKSPSTMARAVTPPPSAKSRCDSRRYTSR